MEPRKGIRKARTLRRSMTDAERRLWHRLRAAQLNGHKFRRQFPIAPYVLDFACVDLMLAVEVDGGQHDERAEHDEQRTRFLERNGWRVLRYWNNEVLGEENRVLESILTTCLELASRKG
ncbi:endonuclease domain-containing protein [Solimonas sp. K1W22B-7]|uniref:endonuclease domain-containing protein n=1 Tax=Solimonas sp. K1W22B-7 TaxID=2303331 RepID=UPI000E3372BD|nr:DUF559 domain-containing protein [Solimonas sp. K1W22B-7]AXQ27900.1 endonuclease domain-containing protein [Solimonas sp. K1W22B-7]